MEKGKLSEIPALNELLEEKTFSNSGQIYTMDALHTQFKTLNKINDNNEYFLVKVKANQKSLQDKIYETIKLFDKPTDTYTSPMYKSERKNL
jgi:predicted transposase YbfD/YdcC